MYIYPGYRLTSVIYSLPINIHTATNTTVRVQSRSGVSRTSEISGNFELYQRRLEQVKSGEEHRQTAIRPQRDALQREMLDLDCAAQLEAERITNPKKTPMRRLKSQMLCRSLSVDLGEC